MSTATMATTESEVSSGRSDVVVTNENGLLSASQHSRTVPLSSVHGNLMRSRQRQDPMKYVLCILCFVYIESLEEEKLSMVRSVGKQNKQDSDKIFSIFFFVSAFEKDSTKWSPSWVKEAWDPSLKSRKPIPHAEVLHVPPL